MTDVIIETRNLTKTFGEGSIGVSGLDLSVRRRSVYGLIGRNGSGKTTAIRLLMGLIKPDQGTATVLGENLWSSSRSTRSRVGYVSQTQHLPGWMSLADLQRYTSHFFPHWNNRSFRNATQEWALDWRQPVGRMSGGEQRKATLLVALASNPDVLILDEPAAGLDSIARRALVDSLIRTISAQSNCTILLSTHNISDLARIATHIGLMDRGRIVRCETVDALQQTTRRIQVIFPEEAPDTLLLPGLIRASKTGPVINAVCRLDNEQQLDFLYATQGVRVNVFPMGLEEIFLEMFDQSEITFQNGLNHQ